MLAALLVVPIHREVAVAALCLEEGRSNPVALTPPGHHKGKAWCMPLQLSHFAEELLLLLAPMVQPSNRSAKTARCALASLAVTESPRYLCPLFISPRFQTR
jgi:hypothetical protein